MEKILEITRLLGEENANKIKDKITEMLIERVQEDLNEMGVYLVDFESLFDEVIDEVRTDLKNKIAQKYMEKAEEKFSELFD